jgi:hypothetical protein
MDFPFTPTPSSVSPPEIIDPMHEFVADDGFSIRRAKHSRPRRRWTMEYLGRSVDEMRQVRDFLQQQRLGTFEFAWYHPTALDAALISPTTPVTLVWRHGLSTGQAVQVTNSPNPGINNAAFFITRIDAITVTLNGSVAAGISGVCDIRLFVPHARAVMTQNDTFPSPAILIGPEQVLFSTRRTGYYNFSVQIEELF